MSVLGIKQLFESEDHINIGVPPIKFLNSSIPMIPTNYQGMKPKEKRLIKVGMLFVEEVLGFGLKLLDSTTTITLEVKDIWKKVLLNVPDTDISFSSNEAIGILDARSLGYYKIEHKNLWKIVALIILKVFRGFVTSLIVTIMKVMPCILPRQKGQ